MESDYQVSRNKARRKGGCAQQCTLYRGHIFKNIYLLGIKNAAMSFNVKFFNTRNVGQFNFQVM